MNYPVDIVWQLENFLSMDLRDIDSDTYKNRSGDTKRSIFRIQI